MTTVSKSVSELLQTPKKGCTSDTVDGAYSQGFDEGVRVAANHYKELLYEVVDELNLSDAMIEKHGPLGTAPAELVREVLAQKDLQIAALERGFIKI